MAEFTENKILVRHSDEFLDSSGHSLQMCVVEELEPIPEDSRESKISEQAITTFAGMALCRKHLKQVANCLGAGYSIEEIQIDIINHSF